jgi:hypothetical protein
VFETYSKRQKKQHEAQSDVYQYDDLPNEFRSQVIWIWRRAIGPDSAHGVNLFQDPPLSDKVWDDMAHTMAEETGRLEIGRPDQGSREKCVTFLMDADTYGDSVESEFGRELQSPSAAAGLRRGFSPARPPGLGGGHCALGLVDAVAHEPCGGSPMQGYKG